MTNFDFSNSMSQWTSGVVNRSSHFRAGSGIGYIELIQAIEYIWSESHPEIPMYAMGLETYPVYPCIIYNLDRRITFRDETKPRQREMIMTPEGEKGLSIFGQRFDNLISFTAVTKSDAQLAEQIIEVFEDFLLEFTPVFKQLGVSEMVYHQRMTDAGENRNNTDIVKRKLVYRFILEKVVTRDWDKINNVLIDLRLMLSGATPEILTDPATPEGNIETYIG